MKCTREKERPLNQKNSAKEPNKKKRRLTLGQSEIMQDFYLNTSQYPTPEQYTGLANQLKIDKAKVKNWFHNRRARDRKRGNSVPLKLDHFKSIEFPSYEYSGELLFRMLALRATEAVKRDIEMKTSSLKSASFNFGGCNIFKERTPLQNNGNLTREQVVHRRESFSGDCPIDDSIPDFEKLRRYLFSSNSHSSDSHSSNSHSSDLHVEYLNCLYPLLSGN